MFPVISPEKLPDLLKAIESKLNLNLSISSNCRNERSEDTYVVPSAVSVKRSWFENADEKYPIPQNPNLGENTYGSAHGDSYCSETADTLGPCAEKIRVIRQRNPYGFVPCQTCNDNNQMIGVSLNWFDFSFYLVVWDENLNLISSTFLQRKKSGSFGGGYFFMNQHNYTIVGTTSQLICFDTRDVKSDSGSGDNNTLSPVWTSDDLLDAFSLSPDNALYAAMPVWSDNPNLFWLLFAGKYRMSSGEYEQPCGMGVVEITPNESTTTGCVTVKRDILLFENEWNNNTFSVDESGAYFVTNVVEQLVPGAKASRFRDAHFGFLRKLSFDESCGKLEKVFQSQHSACGYMKMGPKNISSGTTPTLMDIGGKKLITITDNADPQINVLVHDRTNGEEYSRIPVFSPMRSADEASLIGWAGIIIAENNYGHDVTFPKSQLSRIEPGMARIDVTVDVDEKVSAESTWNDESTSFLAMSMLARKSGVVYAHSADWNDEVAVTEGAMYYINAIDAFTGRTIWRVPLGRGIAFCHDYGGVYFNRRGTMYVGTAWYMIAIQNAV